MKFLFTALLFLVSSIFPSSLFGYTFCNNSKKSINVLIFANQQEAASFLNQYRFSLDENGPTITVNLQEKSATTDDSATEENELSELPPTGWIRISYSSAGSAAYLQNNNAIIQYAELKANACKKEDPTQLLKTYDNIIDNQLYFLLFETFALITILPDGHKEYYVRLLESRSALVDEEINYGSLY